MKNPIHSIRTFYQDTVAELKKCTWSTWRELSESTFVVIVASLVLALLVLAMDVIVRHVIRFVT